MTNPTWLDPEIVAFLIGPKLHTSATPTLAITGDDERNWETRGGQVRPACSLFPPISFHQALFATPHDVAEFLLLTVNDGYPRPLLSTPLLSLRVNHLFSNPSSGISHPSVALDHLPYVPDYMPSFIYFLVCYFLRIPCDLARADVRYHLPAGSVTACS